MQVVIVSILYVVVIVNLLLTLIIFSRGVHNVFNILFGLTTFGVVAWGMSISAFYLRDIALEVNWAIPSHFFALFIATTFVYFSGLFPSRYRHFRRVYQVVPMIIFVVMSVILVKTPLIVGPSSEMSYLLGLLYPLYGGVLSLFFIFGFILLFLQFRRSTSDLRRKQITFVLLGAIVSSVGALFTDLILPWFGIFSYLWVGPVATLALVVAIFATIAKYQLFRIRVIVAELFSALIVGGLLIEIFFADTIERLLISTFLIIFIVIVSFFLIRSVSKEIEGRREIERLASDLKQANERLKELDQRKSEFLSLASHQLRTPLTAIKGYSSMLVDGEFGDVPEQPMGAVKRIFESSKRLVTVVDDFLTISRIEQDRLEYNFKRADLAEVIETIVGEMRIAAENKGLGISLTTKGETCCTIIDEGKIKQVFGNLIDNAIKYTPEGSITVALTNDHKNKSVRFAVTDTGVGMESETIELLFKKFSRASDASRVNTTGSGLGLYIAHRIIKEHGGHIWATSKGKGKGATFYVELPLDFKRK